VAIRSTWEKYTISWRGSAEGEKEPAPGVTEAGSKGFMGGVERLTADGGWCVLVTGKTEGGASGDGGNRYTGDDGFGSATEGRTPGG
jgi:hypothetical protein